MAKYEEMTIPKFVENPNTKNEWSEFQDITADPFDSKNGELVDKKEVKEISQETVHKILEWQSKHKNVFLS